jgi:hypothetical protein
MVSVRRLTVLSLLLATALSACAPRHVTPLAPRATGPVPVYANPAAGFTLEVPLGWNGRYRPIELPAHLAAAVHPGATHVVRFEYIGQSVYVAPHAVLTLAVVPRAGPSAGNTVDPGAWEPVGESEAGLIVATLPGPNPYAPSSADARAFEEMRVTTEQVRQALATGAR